MDDFCTIIVSPPPKSPDLHCTASASCDIPRTMSDLSAKDCSALLSRLASSTPVNEDNNDQYQAYCVIA
ncbi:B mating type pheromone [Dichomitus squalens]|uniref:B mating type pheromone n=1 Tax=Dichomitus squalens TaxID=114155 RepID=A0A4Q9PPA1_9APHY|nr:B mating type pheromone [Dichomitus squalens]